MRRVLANCSAAESNPQPRSLNVGSNTTIMIRWPSPGLATGNGWRRKRIAKPRESWGSRWRTRLDGGCSEWTTRSDLVGCEVRHRRSRSGLGDADVAVAKDQCCRRIEEASLAAMAVPQG